MQQGDMPKCVVGIAAGDLSCHLACQEHGFPTVNCSDTQSKPPGSELLADRAAQVVLKSVFRITSKAAPASPTLEPATRAPEIEEGALHSCIDSRMH